MFTDFVVDEDISNELDFQELYKEIKEYKIENNQGNNFSNRGGWQSQSIDFNLVVSKYQNMKRLFDVITGLIQHFINNPKVNIGLSDAWINVNQSNHYNSLHFHPNSLLSGTVYVSLPDNLNDTEGHLVFTRERSFRDYSIASMFAEENNNQYTTDSFRIKPKVGKIVFFPSYLQHEVEPHYKEGERISIAFNCNIYNQNIG